MLLTTFLINFLLLTVTVVLVSCQYGPAPGAPPLTNYDTEDQSRHETIDQSGNVRGEYSYIDPNGRTIKVKYTAGKNGFHVYGQHVPDTKQKNVPAQYYQHYQQRNDVPVPGGINNYGDYQQAQLRRENEISNLFEPAPLNLYPAASDGQLKSYREALVEERQEQQKQKQNIQNYPAYNNQGYNFNVPV